MRTRVIMLVAVALLAMTVGGASPVQEASAIDDDAAALRDLRRLVPPGLRGTCERLRARDMDTRVRESVVALVCYPGAPVDDVGLYRFDDLERLERWWDVRLAMIDGPLATGDCEAGSAGVEATPDGEMACYRSRGTARVRWIDRERLLYGSIDMRRKNIAMAYAWWGAIAGPISLIDLETPLCEADPFEWTRLDPAPGFGRGKDMSTPILSAIAASTAGDVLLGRHITESPVAWHAPEAQAWEHAAIVGSPNGCKTCTPSLHGNSGVPRDVIAWGDGFVSVGASSLDMGMNGLIWTSADGAEWSVPLEIPGASLNALAATSSLVGAAGVLDPRWDSDPGYPALWISPDTQSWTRRRISDERGKVRGLAVSPDGVWIVSGSSLWRSTDGAEWDEVSLPDDAISGLARFPGPVAWSPSGFVLGVILATSDEDLAYGDAGELWISPDGIDWSLAGISTLPISALAAGESGGIAFTRPPTGPDELFVDIAPTVLVSADGASWCRLEPEDLRRAEVEDATLAPDGRVLMAGHKQLSWGKPATWMAHGAEAHASEPGDQKEAGS